VVSNADSQDLSVFLLDAVAEVATPLQTIALGGAAMPMAVSPDRHLLYVALRSQPYRVVTLAFEVDGRLRKVQEASLADSMAYVATDRTGRWLLAASYGGHKITVNAIGEDGQVGAVHQLLSTAPNAHSIQADAANRFVLVTSLGGDTVGVWRLDVARGLLSPHDPASLPIRAGTGPRHLRLDRAQRFAYLLCELDASLRVLAFDAKHGTLHEVQSLSVLPPGFMGRPWAAELHLTPDGSLLVASERTSSTLATFRVDAHDGKLSLLGHTPTEHTPRGFAIDPSGRVLMAAGQLSHALSLHVIDPRTGALARRQQLPLGRTPTWVEIVEAP
jgi:6-phosphogluconolactonase